MASSDEYGVEASAGGVLEEASEVEGLEELPWDFVILVPR